MVVEDTEQFRVSLPGVPEPAKGPDHPLVLNQSQEELTDYPLIGYIPSV
jgi:hypothetical protein